jgi:iron complex outermembrane receptor protein
MNVHVPQSGKRLLLSPISMAILALMAGTNVAYAAEDAQRAAAAAAPAAEQVAPADAGKITEVFVTATKRSTSLQKTPVAVTALNAAALDDNHVQTIQDVVNLVPGFAATGQGDHGVITMTMRGIGNDSAKTEYADPEVASFVDGSTRRVRKARPRCCSTWTRLKCCAARKARCGAVTRPSARSTCRP